MTTRKTILIISVLSFFAIATTAYAQGFVPLAEIPGLTSPDVTSIIPSQGFAAFFNNLYKYCIGLSAVLAVIMIVWGGLEISTQDSISKQGAGRERITQAIYGLVLVLSPVLVFSIINPAILNLSLNMPPLDLTYTPYQPSTSGTGTQTPTVDAGTAAAITAGCTVTGTLLKTAICPTQQAAQNFAAACTTGSGNVPFFTTDHKATCGTENGPSYSFADTSSGILATIFGYSRYEPLASTPANPNNGSAVVHFAAACTADGGTTCESAIKPPCASSVIHVITTGSLTTTSTSCWNFTLSCTDGRTGAGGCSTSPQYTPIQTQ